MHEERSDERVLREGAEGVRLQGPFERSPAGVLGSNALIVNDDFCREGAGELAMNETVDDQLAHDGIAGAEGEVSFHKKAVWKMFPAEPGDLGIGVYEVRVVLAHKCIGFVGGAQRSNNLVLAEKNDGCQVIALLSR